VWFICEATKAAQGSIFAGFLPALEPSQGSRHCCFSRGRILSFYGLGQQARFVFNWEYPLKFFTAEERKQRAKMVILSQGGTSLPWRLIFRWRIMRMITNKPSKLCPAIQTRHRYKYLNNIILTFSCLFSGLLRCYYGHYSSLCSLRSALKAEKYPVKMLLK